MEKNALISLEIADIVLTTMLSGKRITAKNKAKINALMAELNNTKY